MELESQVHEAEGMNQTLTSAYQSLRSEIDQLEAEKAQEQYYENFSTQPGFAFDPAYATAGSNMAGYGQGDTAWADNNWTPQEWQGGDDCNFQG